MWKAFSSCHDNHKQLLYAFNTPFAFHYKKIRIHLREMATNRAKIHSLGPKQEHLRITQIQ